MLVNTYSKRIFNLAYRFAGSYQDSFDGSGLASGVYIYRLTAGSLVQSRDMLLVT